MENTQNIQNDVIDLKELFGTIAKRKKLIYSITVFITLSAIAYLYLLAKPVYQVQAMVELGKINAGTTNETLLDNIQDVKQKLGYIYGIKSKKRQAYPKVKSISASKESKGIFSLTVEAYSNDKAINFTNKIIKSVENQYTHKINSYIETQKELIALTQSDINNTNKNLQNLQNSLKGYNQKILNLSIQDSALAGIYAIQISQNQVQAQQLQSRISVLKAKKSKMKLSISPLRIRQTHIVGKIEVLEKPVKPKKLLIIIVSFITALMFSVFLAFFLEFLHGLKEENN